MGKSEVTQYCQLTITRLFCRPCRISSELGNGGGFLLPGLQGRPDRLASL